MIWSAEIDAVQLVWGNLPPGPIDADCGENSVVLEHVGGAGGLVVDGLEPDADHKLTLSWNGGVRSWRFRTLAPPPGEELTRFATVSDLHLGAKAFGFLKTMTDAKPTMPAQVNWRPERNESAMRCAVAATTEALRWGATRIVVKGDIADHRTKSAYSLASEYVDHFADATLHLVLGNHDVDNRSEMAIPQTLGTQAVSVVREPEVIDLDGLRIILADTTELNRGPGTISNHAEAILEAAGQSPTPVFLATHHQYQPYRYATYWPPGIPGPEANAFLDDLAAIKPDSFITSGHTHRNRVRHRGPLAITQVASTRDWPGVWAGYRVYESGIVQNVRRVLAPGAVHWHEYSKDAVIGLWRFWSSGQATDRNLVHQWPNPVQ